MHATRQIGSLQALFGSFHYLGSPLEKTIHAMAPMAVSLCLPHSSLLAFGTRKDKVGLRNFSRSELKMGKVKKAKKFRQKHLPEKIDASKKHKKHAGYVANRKPKSVNPEGEPKKESFDAPAQDAFDKPEFEKYLSDSEDDNDSEEAEEAEREYLEGQEETESKLTMETLHQLESQLDKSVKPVKTLIKAFVDDDHVKDPKVFSEVARICLSGVPQALRRLAPPQSKRAGELSTVLKQFCSKLAEFIKNGTSERLPALLAATSRSIPYFLTFRKALKELVRSLVSIFANDSASDEAKLSAFSVIRDAVLNHPGALADPVLKYGYEALVRLSGRTNAHTIESVNLAKNLFSQLYSVDEKRGYQQAFQQLRTLAMHLKTSLDKVRNPGYDQQVVYQWQFVQMLDFFSRVISVAAEMGRGPMQQLIHPLVQVSLRTATLIPSPVWFPLRFYIVRSMVRLSRHTGVYIPLSPIILEVPRSSLFSHKGQKSSLKQVDFNTTLHVPQTYIDTAVYQNCVTEELVDIIAEVFALHTKSIAFPELIAPVTITLRRVVRKPNIPSGLSRQLTMVSERLQANSDFIMKQRSNVTFGPGDTDQVAAFLKETPWQKTPLGQLAEARRKVREERARLLAETNRSDSEAESGSEGSDTAAQDIEDAEAVLAEE